MKKKSQILSLICSFVTGSGIQNESAKRPLPDPFSFVTTKAAFSIAKLAVVGGMVLAFLQCCQQPMSKINPMTMGVLVPIALLSSLAYEVRQGGGSIEVCDSRWKMWKELQQHRDEKIQIACDQAIPTVMTWLASTIVTMLFRSSGSPADLSAILCLGAPSLTHIMMCFTVMMSLQLVDSCLDECRPARPHATLISSIVVCLASIGKLVGSHIAFTILITKIVLQCLIAKTADDMVWIAMTIPFFLGLGMLIVNETLPALPVGVSSWMAILHLASMVFFGSLHERTQSTCPGAVKWVWRAKFTWDQVLVAMGLPLSWSVLDSVTFQMYLLSQSLSDTLAMKSLE